MADAQLAPILCYLRRLAGAPRGEDLSDSVLLGRLVWHRDPAAFEALVRRYGPLVWGVCRRVLHREQDAEDAFQATFLTLARRAASIRKPASLASFLHGVAYRIARRLAQDEERRRSAERESNLTPVPDPMCQAAWRELGRILEEEIHALPERLRAALLLCYWEGLTNEEAAQRLGWACGTVKTRLAKAREVLRDRLTRRGISLPAGVAALLLAPSASDATVPPTLTAAVRAINLGTVGASPRVAALAEGGLKHMALTKAKIGLVLLFAVGLGAAGIGVLTKRASVGERAVASAETEGEKASPRQPKEQPPALADLQGDPLPAGTVTRLGTVRFRMDGLVYACAWSPDGKTLAASSDGNVIRLFNAATGKSIRRLRGQNLFPVLSLAWSPDGKTLASGCADSTLNIWEPATGKMLRQFATPQPVWSLTFTRDGKGLVAGVGDQVAGAKDSLVLLWDSATGKELRRFAGHKQAVRCVALSPDGRAIASAGGAVRLWELETGKLIRRLTGQKEPIRSLAFSPDGKLLATGSKENMTWLWETSTGKVRYRLPANLPKGRPLTIVGDIHALAFSPNGKTLVTGAADHALCFWDVGTGEKLRELTGVNLVGSCGWHDGGIQCVAFSPDGRKLAVGQDSRIALIDPQSGKEIHQFQGHGDAVRQVLFGPDGKHLITVSDDPTQQFLEWDSISGRLIRQVPSEPTWVHLATFSPDRKILATSENFSSLRLCDTATGKKIREISLPLKRFALPYAVAFSPDGKLLAVAGSEAETVWLLDTATGKQVCNVEGAGGKRFRAMYLSFSLDGRRLASAGVETIHLAEVPSGRQIQRIILPKDHSISALAVSPDGRILATPRLITFKYTIALWEAASGKERLTLPASDPGQFKAIAFSPDGRLLAAGNYAGIVLLWDTVAGKQVGRLVGHPGEVMCLAFSPDGKRLASGSLDTTTLIWDVTRLTRPRRRPAPLAQKELEASWSALADADAAKAYQAILTLESMPEQAVPLLAEHLRSRPSPDAERIARLLAQLDGERFAERERATEALRKLGWVAEPALCKMLEGKPSLEMHRRMKELLDGIRKMEAPPELLQVLRGMEVLERIGTPTARGVLERIAGDVAESRLTREAKASLQRLTNDERTKPH